MTPIPAVVTVDVSDDVETALRRCVSSGHTRLVVTEDENPDRVRGHRPRQLARPRCYMAEGPHASIEALVKRRADRARRPSRSTTCSPTCSASAPRWRSSSTSTAARRASSPSRTSSRRSSARSTTRPTRPGGAVRRLANGDWFVRGHVALSRPDRLRRRAAGRHRRLQLGRRLRLRRARAGCPSAATPSAPTATRSASSRCARTAIEAVRIRHRETVPERVLTAETRPARSWRAGRCCWEEVHMRVTFAGAVSAACLNAH